MSHKSRPHRRKSPITYETGVTPKRAQEKRKFLVSNNSFAWRWLGQIGSKWQCHFCQHLFTLLCEWIHGFDSVLGSSCPFSATKFSTNNLNAHWGGLTNPAVPKPRLKKDSAPTMVQIRGWIEAFRHCETFTSTTTVPSAASPASKISSFSHQLPSDRQVPCKIASKISLTQWQKRRSRWRLSVLFCFVLFCGCAFQHLTLSDMNRRRMVRECYSSSSLRLFFLVFALLCPCANGTLHSHFFKA